MADETSTPVVATPPTADEPATRPDVDFTAQDPVVAPVMPAAGGEKSSVEEDPAPIDAAATAAAAPAPTDELDTVGERDTQDKGPIEGATHTMNGALDSTKKLKNRKSTGAAVPEHKAKKLNRKKSTANLHLHVAPGELWMARVKGHPPWPCIICDEEMLPESLLKGRPVSAMRTDGSYREDFLEGGKNARDRRYAIMFLGTNEFAWTVNTDLIPFDMEEVKAQVEKGQGKKTRLLWDAYKVAVEEPDLSYFKDLLTEHDKATQKALEEEQAAEEEFLKKEAEKQVKKEKKEKRKSKVKDASEGEDVDMENVGADSDAAAKKAKTSTKKRKKEADSDDEDQKPAKTPKIKVKVKEPKAEDSAIKAKKLVKTTKKVSKPKNESPSEHTESPSVEEAMSEKDKLAKREKQVLYLRHKLQKGFLTRDQIPKEEEMSTMAQHFDQLEQYTELEPAIIRNTKIHKVLKAILKLNTIPKDESFKFKSRSNELLTRWNKALAGDSGEFSAAEQAATATNGVDHEEPTDTKSPDTAVAPTVEAIKTDETAKDVVMEDAPKGSIVTTVVGKDVKDEADGDVDMQDVNTTGALAGEPDALVVGTIEEPAVATA